MHHTTRQVLQVRFLRRPRHLHVLKPMIRQAWFNRHHSVGGAYIHIPLKIPPQILRIQRPIRVDPLTVSKLYRLARLPAHPQPAPAHHVLSHVEHVHPRLWLADGHRPQLLRQTDRLVMLAHKPPGNPLDDLDRRPVFIVEPRTVPIGLLLSRIVLLAPNDVRRHNRSLGRRPPALIRNNHTPLSIGAADLQLHPQPQPPPVQRPPADTHQTRVPAFRHDGGDRIAPGLQQSRHIVCLVLNPLPIVRPLRRQYLLAHPSAVDI